MCTFRLYVEVNNEVYQYFVMCCWWLERRIPGEGRDPVTSYSAVTQLCSTHARRMFPCWDEPSVKTTFDITVILDSSALVALSNMVS